MRSCITCDGFLFMRSWFILLHLVYFVFIFCANFDFLRCLSFFCKSRFCFSVCSNSCCDLMSVLHFLNIWNSSYKLLQSSITLVVDCMSQLSEINKSEMWAYSKEQKAAMCGWVVLLGSIMDFDVPLWVILAERRWKFFLGNLTSYLLPSFSTHCWEFGWVGFK